jgi:hypothetical protein
LPKSSKFDSPREEALEIAINTRRKIIEGKENPIAVVRSCLVISNILNKNEMKNMLLSELSGYRGDEDIPDYRCMSCLYEDKKYYDNTSRDFVSVRIPFSAHDLFDSYKKNEIIRYHNEGKIKFLHPSSLHGVLSKITDWCLKYLNDIINELQYGGAVELLMEEIRKNTDEKLANFGVNLGNETQSLLLNLKSTNPADWNMVAHSCRKIVKLLADKVFPARDKTYKMKDGRPIKVGDPHYINRLCAFLDQKVAGEERKFLIAELEYFESYLRQIIEYTQMGEHKPSIEKYHADMIAIHTYLICSEILKHYDIEEQ